MKIIVLINTSGKVVGASLANGDEKTLKNIENLLGSGLVDLTCQIIEADSLIDLGKFVAAEIKEAEKELETEL